MTIIKVGFLISYDYEFLKISLPRIYSHVSQIFLAVDAEGLTWSGKPITISPLFWDWVTEFDQEGKIVIYRDSFYVPGLSPMECDTRERNMLAGAMGKADWYVQIDSDEYFLDFERFVLKLKTFKPIRPTTISCRVATLVKDLTAGYLIVDASRDRLRFATNNPVYDLARENTSGNQVVDWDDLVVHQSWARSDDEIAVKLSNWSHQSDFNTTSFFNLWKVLDEDNYRYIKDFHPLYGPLWPELIYVQGDIQHVLDTIKKQGTFTGLSKSAYGRKPFLSRLWKRVRFWR